MVRRYARFQNLVSKKRGKRAVRKGKKCSNGFKNVYVLRALLSMIACDLRASKPILLMWTTNLMWTANQNR